MGIFSRFRDIVNANFSSMLDHAEDPEKMIRLMIGEMEETLIEIKAACAKVMAEGKRSNRFFDEAMDRAHFWKEKAGLAVSRGRDDLAREALHEKRRFNEKADALEKETRELDHLVDKYQSDIRQLEEKLAGAREKQRTLVQRHRHAQKKMRAQDEIRRMDSSDAIKRFDKFENRIERMEAEADLVNYGTKDDLEGRFEKLEKDETIEKELAALKDKNKE